MPERSAGLLIYRWRDAQLEVLLVHPGGPFWRNKDVGSWQFPKGRVEADETAVEAAMREAAEELGTSLAGATIALGEVRQAGGKYVEAFALEAEIDADAVISNMFEIEWPRTQRTDAVVSRSGRRALVWSARCARHDAEEPVAVFGSVGRPNYAAIDLSTLREATRSEPIDQGHTSDQSERCGRSPSF